MSDLDNILAAAEAENGDAPVETEEQEQQQAQDDVLELTEGDEEAPEDDEGGEGDAETGEEEGEQPKKRSRSKPMRERLAELTAEKHQLRRELEDLRSVVEGRGKPEPESRQQEAPALPEKPSPEQFALGDVDPAYYEALADWKVETALAKERAERAEQDQKLNAKREMDAQQLAISEKLHAGMVTVETQGQEKYADFADRIAEAVEARGGEPLPPLIATGISISPVGADLAYRLATDDTAAARLEKLAKGGAASANAAALALGELEGEYLADGDDGDLDVSDPLDMARMLGRMRTRQRGVKAAAPTPKVVVTNAPEPPAQRIRGGSARVRVNEDTEDADAFYRQHAAKLGL